MTLCRMGVCYTKELLGDQKKLGQTLEFSDLVERIHENLASTLKLEIQQVFPFRAEMVQVALVH